MKNAALWAVITFFDSNEKFFGESDTERQNWAVEALAEQKFIYGYVKVVKVRGIGHQTVSFNPHLVVTRLFSYCSLIYISD